MWFPGLPKGTVVVVAFLSAPLIAWFYYFPPALWHFASLSTFLLYVGQTAGVMGFSFFTLTLLLSIRISFLERIFGDLARAYKFHQTLGGITLILLSWHPILLSTPFLNVSAREAAFFFLPFEERAKLFGIMALFILQFAIVFTYFIRIPYEVWKKIHKLLGLAFVFGGWHALTIVGEIRAMPVLERVFAGFLIAGIGVIFYRVLFPRFFVKRSRYAVGAIDLLGPRQEFTRVTLTPVNKPILFRAGQFAYVLPDVPGMKEQHPFSICSPEGSENLVFTAKNAGDFTAKLPTLAVGSTVWIEGPFGRFSYTQGGKKQIWIAGGIGVTPFLSLAASLPAGYDVTFFYSVKTEGEAVGLEPLRAASERAGGGLKVILWVTENAGHINGDVLIKERGALSEYDIFVCGPRGMIAALRTDLFLHGVPHERVHEEVFSLLPFELR